MMLYFDKAEQRLAKYKLHYYRTPRKAILKFIWWNLCCLVSMKKSSSSFHDDRLHIAVSFGGGIGDYLFAAKYVEALASYLSTNSVFDILAPSSDIGVIKTIFHGKKYIHNVLAVKTKTKYDLMLRVVRFPEIIFYEKKRLDEKTIQYVRKLEDFYHEKSLMIKNDYLGRCWSLIMGRKREDQADIDNVLNMAQLDFCVNLVDSENKILSKFNLEKQNFITLQTGSGTHFQHVKNEVRQWPIEYYNELVKLLKNKYPQYKIIQLGVKYQIPCQSVDMDLRSKTTIEELMVLLKYATLHISQEGGMPIIRHFVKGGKSVVLFGATDENFFGFRENINISNRSCGGCCEWLIKDWMKKCLKSEKNAECMINLTPELVMKNISKELL